MIRFGRIMLLMGAVVLSATAMSRAQQKKTVKAAAAPQQKQQRIPFVHQPVPVFIGASDISGGSLPKSAFDSLMRQGLSARDSAGNPLVISEFYFFYKERNIYEDSVGNYYVGVDMITDVNRGNQLNAIVSANIYERTKAGDTVMFDNIIVLLPDSNLVRGIPFRIGITR